MKPYLRQLVDHLERELGADASTRRVLEIGPDPDFAVANHLCARYDARVYTIGAWPVKDLSPLAAGVSFLQEDATDMPFRDGLFDLVVGLSLLEHVTDMPALAAEIARVLTPDGRAFLTGGPLWTSAVGHHLWVSVDGTHYRFNDASNCIPPWAHLTMTREALRDLLCERTPSPGHADAIVAMVYESPLLNRQSPQEIMAAFRQDFSFSPQFYKPRPLPPDLARQLGPGTDWEAQAMFLFMRKETQA